MLASSPLFSTRTLAAPFVLAVALAGCGRDVTPAEDVKLLGVGNDPEEIGPSPKPYGGVIELNHVGFAGGHLPLAAMGLSSFNEAGPNLVSMAPPYEAVFGLTYIFDTKLRGATTFTLVMPNPPPAEGACYTQFYPEGPFDSGFNTVDVGDYVQFRNVTSENRDPIVRMGRIPRDYPPEASRLSVVYQALQGYAPTARTRYLPAEDSNQLADMEEVVYRSANFPFGAGVAIEWPGGFTTFDKPVGSVPLPYRTEEAILNLPQSLGGVQVSWNGPRYTYDRLAEQINEVEAAPVTTCLEYTSPLEYGGGNAPTSPADCVELTSPPNGAAVYNQYKGQMYTGPWETQDGVTFTWEGEATDDTVTFAVKFLAPIDREASNLTSNQIQLDVPRGQPDAFRDARVCELNDAVARFDEEQWLTEQGELRPVLQGDPQSVISQVVCNVPKGSGSFTLQQEALQRAYDFAVERGAAGSLFMMGRQTTAEVAIPDVKDPYDQRHNVDPIFVTAKTVRIGRFQWDVPTSAPAQDGGDQ